MRVEVDVQMSVNREIVDIKAYNLMIIKDLNTLEEPIERYKEISLILKISPRTVETHINSIKIKASTHFKGDLLTNFRYLLNMHK